MIIATQNSWENAKLMATIHHQPANNLLISIPLDPPDPNRHLGRQLLALLMGRLGRLPRLRRVRAFRRGEGHGGRRDGAAWGSGEETVEMDEHGSWRWENMRIFHGFEMFEMSFWMALVDIGNPQVWRSSFLSGEDYCIEVTTYFKTFQIEPLKGPWFANNYAWIDAPKASSRLDLSGLNGGYQQQRRGEIAAKINSGTPVSMNKRMHISASGNWCL